jgi:hypothetical protein
VRTLRDRSFIMGSSGVTRAVFLHAGTGLKQRGDFNYGVRSIVRGMTIGDGQDRDAVRRREKIARQKMRERLSPLPHRDAPLEVTRERD